MCQFTLVTKNRYYIQFATIFDIKVQSHELAGVKDKGNYYISWRGSPLLIATSK